MLHSLDVEAPECTITCPKAQDLPRHLQDALYATTHEHASCHYIAVKARYVRHKNGTTIQPDEIRQLRAMAECGLAITRDDGCHEQTAFFVEFLHEIEHVTVPTPRHHTH